MEKVKNLGNVIFSRTLVLVLVISFIFFLFETYQDSLSNYQYLKKTISERESEIVSLRSEIDDWNNQIDNLDNPEFVEVILRRRGYGKEGESIYKYEIPEPVTPLEETLQKNTNKSVLEFVVDYFFGTEGG